MIIVKGVYTFGVSETGEYFLIYDKRLSDFISANNILIEPLGYDCYVSATSNVSSLCSVWVARTQVKYYFKDLSTRAKFLLMM